MWTKDEMRLLMDLWDSSNPEEIGEKIGVSRQKVNYMANVMRKAGVPLQLKYQRGTVSLMIKELIADNKYKK